MKTAILLPILVAAVTLMLLVLFGEPTPGPGCQASAVTCTLEEFR